MIDVLEVASTLELGNGVLEGGIDTPMPDVQIEGYGIEIEGWAVGFEEPIDRIEILHGDRVLRTVTNWLPRPDIANAYPQAPRSGLSGYRTLITFVGLPMTPVLRVAAVIGVRRWDIARLTLRRRPLRVPPDQLSMHPLIVNTMGRTGSVWLSQLLGVHPQVITYRPFQSEPRVGSYWMHILTTLSNPASMVQALAPLRMQGTWWLGTDELSNYERALDAEIAQWLVSENVEELAAFCLTSIQRFYARAAEAQGKDRAVYYAEKYPSSFVPSLLLELDPRSREVFLVRDPRDQIASMAAWSERGKGDFGNTEGGVEGYMRWLSPHTKQLLAHWRARASRSFLIRYEDLVLEPDDVLQRLFSYLEIDADPETVAQVVARAQEEMSDLQRAHQTSSSTATSIGRWRTEIDDAFWPEMQDLFAEELKSWYPEAA